MKADRTLKQTPSQPKPNRNVAHGSIALFPRWTLSGYISSSPSPLWLVCLGNIRAPLSAKIPFFFCFTGLVYSKVNEPFLFFGAFCVLCNAPILFFSAVANRNYGKLSRLFFLEWMDGVGNGSHVVIVTYLRLVSYNTPGLIVSVTTAFFLITPRDLATFTTLLNVLLTMITHSLAWWAIYTLVACVFPKKPQRISQLISSIAGFASGFLITKSQMPSFLQFLFFINPVFWAFSAVMRHITEGKQLFCQEASPLDCQDKAANVVLAGFSLDEYHPSTSYLTFVTMAICCLVLASLALECNAAQGGRIQRVMEAVKRKIPAWMK